MDSPSKSSGTLYLVATPIGNLEDMTFRAVSVLQQVDWIAAEDTRHTGKLLRHFNIDTPQLSYHHHNRQTRLPQLLENLHHGQTLALVSDAGTPGISDPGQELVAACVATGITVIPLPGATAFVSAAICSGLDLKALTFIGFLPPKHKDRNAQLDLLKSLSHTLVFYEAPHRLRTTLADLATHFGDRPVCLARELTKLHEQFWYGTLQTAIDYFQHQEPKGEFCLVVAGQESRQTITFSDEQLLEELQQLMQQGLSRSQASKQLATALSLPRRQIYQLSLQLSDP